MTHPTNWMSTKQPSLFLDRDGTLIVDADYPKDPAVVQLMDGVVEFLQTMQEHGFALIVVSNQSGIGRGKIHPEEAQAVHERFLQLFAQHGIYFQGAYHCPHAPEDDCECRKPKPGMLLQAARDHNLELSRSFIVGDKMADVEAGQRAGCQGILFRRKAGDKDTGSTPDAIAQTYDEVRDYILKQWKRMNDRIETA